MDRCGYEEEVSCGTICLGEAEHNENLPKNEAYHCLANLCGVHPGPPEDAPDMG